MSTRTLEEIFEEHLAVTKAGFERFSAVQSESRQETAAGFVAVHEDIAAVRDEMTNGFAAVGGEVADGFAKLDSRLSALERAVEALKRP